MVHLQFYNKTTKTKQQRQQHQEITGIKQPFNIINKTTTKSTVNKDNSKKKTTKNKDNSKKRQH